MLGRCVFAVVGYDVVVCAVVICVVVITVVAFVVDWWRCSCCGGAVVVVGYLQLRGAAHAVNRRCWRAFAAGDCHRHR